MTSWDCGASCDCAETEERIKRRRLVYDDDDDDDPEDDDYRLERVDDDAFYEAVYHERWSESRRLLSRKDAARLLECSREEDGPLCCACWNNAPMDVLESIHALDPGLMTRTYSDDQTPLQFACWCGTEEVVRFFLREAPESVRRVNAARETPLHTAVRNARSPSVVRWLLSEHPASVRTMDARGRDPATCFVEVWRDELEANYDRLEDASSFAGRDDDGDDLTVFRKTLSLLAEAFLYGEIADGETTAPSTLSSREFLLHDALRCETIGIPDRFLAALIRTGPSEYVRHDKDGNFPLHCACMLSPKGAQKRGLEKL